MAHDFPLPHYLNAILGPTVVTVGGWIGVTFADPARPIPGPIAHLLLVMVTLLLFFTWLRRRLSVDNPPRWQHLVELIVLGIRGLIDSIVGPRGRPYLFFHVSIGTFIYLSNALGLISLFESPTANINVTAGCALCVFAFYNWVGIREQGLWTYLKHFAGPVPLIAPLMIPVEILSHLARPFSLSVRLFANIFGEDMIILTLAALLPFLLPLPIMGLALFTTALQAFVFVVLSIVYLSGAVAHHEAEHAGAH